jgi:hypothetical protein
MRRFIAFVMVATWLAASTSGVLAHEEFRVIGTISKQQPSMISVKTREGKIAAIRLDKQTAISRDKKKVTAAELKTGVTVVVDAYGDSEDDLLALEIRIVPPIGQAPAK